MCGGLRSFLGRGRRLGGKGLLAALMSGNIIDQSGRSSRGDASSRSVSSGRDRSSFGVRQETYRHPARVASMSFTARRARLTVDTDTPASAANSSSVPDRNHSASSSRAGRCVGRPASPDRPSAARRRLICWRVSPCRSAISVDDMPASTAATSSASVINRTGRAGASRQQGSDARTDHGRCTRRVGGG